MIDNTTKRHPRTLQEAFGPYTSRHVYEIPPRTTRTGRVLGVALAVAIGVALALLVIGWAELQGGMPP